MGKSHCCPTNAEPTVMLVDANNILSKVGGDIALVGCALRTGIYFLTMVMVRRAHPTIEIYCYFDISCRRANQAIKWAELLKSLH